MNSHTTRLVLPAASGACNDIHPNHNFQVVKATAILATLLICGMAQAEVMLGQYKFENSLVPSSEKTGLDFNNFYINTAAVDASYIAGTVLQTDNWGVKDKDLAYARSTNHYVGFTITPVAGYQYTLNRIYFASEQTALVNWHLQSDHGGFGDTSSSSIFYKDGNAASNAVTLVDQTLNWTKLKTATEFRFFGIASTANNTLGSIYYNDITLYGDTQARASLTTGKTDAASRVMQNTASVRSTLTINNSALSAGTTTTETLGWTAALSGATGVSMSSTSGTGLASGSTSTIYANVDTSTTGIKYGGTARLTGTNAWRTNGTADTTYVDYDIADTTVVAKRAVTTSTTVALGRQIAGIDLAALPSQPVLLESSGADTKYTHVTVGGNLFDTLESFYTTATGSGTIAASGTFTSFAVTGEGLTGEGTYSDVAVSYTATPVAKRVITSGTVDYGRQISGIDLSTLGSKSYTISSLGANSAFTTVQCNNGRFDGTTRITSSYSATGSGIIASSGTFKSLPVTAVERLTGEGTYSDVAVGYSATLLSKRSVTGSTLALGRQMSGINLSTLGSKTLTLSSSGVDGSYTRTTVATNLFDSTENYNPTATGSGTIAATGTWASYPVTGEGLTGEGTYSDVAVGYSATLLAKRSVTGSTLALGRQMSGINLSTLGSKTLTLSSSGVDGSYTRTTVATNLFDSTENYNPTATASGTIAATGTWASYPVTGEGLTGEGTYSDVAVGYSATLLSKRTVTGSTLALGRQMSGINLSTLGSKTLTLSSSGVDGSYTRTTVAGNLFDSTETFNKTGVTASGTIAATGTWATYGVTPEGLTGEGTYSDVAVGYSATLLAKRSVTADSLSLGRQISGVSLALLTGKTTAFHSNQANSAFTSVSVNGQAFNDTADHTLSVTGSGTLGSSGTFASYAVTKEGLTGETDYSNVTVGYSATPLAKRTVTGSTLALGRQMSGINLSTLGSKTLTLSSSGVDGSYTRTTVATNLFNSTESYNPTATAIGTIAATGTWISYPVTGENLTGEGTYSDVAVGYSATLLAKRAVTADSLSLGRQISGVSLALLTGKTTAFHSNQANSAFTSVSVNGQTFNDTADHTLSVTGSGTLGASGTFASYGVTGEGLTGEGSYSNVAVGYSATPLAMRSVTGSTLALGRQMSGIDLSTLGSKTLTLSSSGADGSYTRTTVATNLFDGTENYNPTATASGTIAATGTWATYGVTKEGLTGEGTYSDVAVGYSATLLSQRTVTGDTLVLGGKYLSGARLDNLGSQTLTLRSDGTDATNTRVTVAGNVFDTTGSFNTSHTGSGIIGKSGTFASYAVTGEGLTGEASYDNVAVGYTAAVVGNAVANKSGVKTAFGEALSAPLTATESLAGLSSWTTADSETIGTTANLLAGTFGDSAGTVSMAWRTRTADETAASYRLAADVVDLTTGTGTLNPFVLQMSYDPSLLPLTGGMTEEMLAAQGGLFLAWLNGEDQWVNAVNGNLGTNTGLADYLGSWLQAGRPMDLGSWGVDTSANSVWAVVDHNSQFSAMSAVPEPANALTLAGLLSSALFLRRRCGKRVA